MSDTQKIDSTLLQMQHLQHRLGELERRFEQLSQLPGKIHAHDLELAQLRAELERLIQQMSLLQKQIETVQGQNAEMADQIREMSARMDSFHTLTRNINQKVGSLPQLLGIVKNVRLTLRAAVGVLTALWFLRSYGGDVMSFLGLQSSEVKSQVTITAPRHSGVGQEIIQRIKTPTED